MDNRGGKGAAAAEEEKESMEYQLLRAYCAKRTGQRYRGYSGVPVLRNQGPASSKFQGPLPSHRPVAIKRKRPASPIVTSLGSSLSETDDDPLSFQCDYGDPFMGDSDRISGVQDGLAQIADFRHIPNEDLEPGLSVGSAVSGVVNGLAHIADSVQIFEEGLATDGPEDQEDVVQKLVELLKKSGDELNEQIKNNKIFKQQLLSAFSYALFEKVTSTTLQSLAEPGQATGQAAVSEEQLQRQQIAWAFEVTSRLSSVDVIPKRRALGYGERYVRMHHSTWVEQHGGWENVFDGEDID